MARTGENIYKRKDGRYEGRYIKSRSISGKVSWGYVYGKTYASVREKLAQCRLNTAPQLAACDLTLSEWLAKWIDSQRQIKPTTRMMYLSHKKNHIDNTIGGIKLKKLNEDILQEFVDDLSERYAPKSVHAYYSMLRLALAEARRRKIITNIYSEIRLPRVKQPVIRVLTREEQKRLEKLLLRRESRLDIGILVSLYTGIRIGELCAMKWENINLKNGTMEVKEASHRVNNEDGDTKTKIIFTTPKSLSSVRTIPLPSFLVAELERYSRPSGYILKDNGLFCDDRAVVRRFKRLLRDAEIEDMKYHSLRHTFATRALEMGFDVKTLSEILGHSTATITLNLYAHSLPEHKRKEMEKFNTLFECPSI